jgi:hypothetical protein
MRRLAPDIEASILTAIRQELTLKDIVASTGVARSTISYIADRNGLEIKSRYNRVKKRSYWTQRLGAFWRQSRQQARGAESIAAASARGLRWGADFGVEQFLERERR